jgi:lipid-A-disaccharide synthase-like uncharacterized protein
MADYFGVAGLVLILAGWCYELYQLMTKKKEEVPLGFAILYCSGSFLLVLHSLDIKDFVFLALNAAAAVVALANIAFSLIKRKHRRN